MDQRDARRKLAEYARRYAERQEKLDREREQLQEERDSAILAAYAAGLSTREIATVFQHLSHQRIAQIVQAR